MFTKRANNCDCIISKTVEYYSARFRLKDDRQSFVLFKINSSPSAFYIIKPTCLVIGF